MNASLRRLERYARGAGVRFAATARQKGWGELGLPDVRGFTPHLRSVKRFAREPDEFPRAAAVARGEVGFDELETAELWLLHDLAHVVWYDVATLTFGAERWRERDFLLEQHLASEAFAVLLLDYHLLARTRHRGLAVELESKSWETLRASVRELPPLDSYEMCRELVTHYLTGAAPLFKKTLARTRLRPNGDVAETLARWREHEASYSDKQRWYVFLWWDDLQGEPLSNRRAVVEDEQLPELVWLVLRLFTADPETAFEAHVARAAVRVKARSHDNFFAEHPKYREPPADGVAIDFRFTDASALPRERIATIVANARAPQAATLFLFWQILALETPDRLAPDERAVVSALAKSVQTESPDPAAWRAVKSICERIVDRASWTPDPRGLSTFFLP